MPDHTIFYVPTTNAITLVQSIVKYCISRGYSGYQDLVSEVDVIDMGDYRKSINQNRGEKDSTEVITIELPSNEITRKVSMQFVKWAEAIVTVLSQHTFADSYTLIRYLLREDDTAKTWNTADSNLNKSVKLAAVARIDGEFYHNYKQRLYDALNNVCKNLGPPWVNSH